jgi:hypothetical protein
LVAVDRSESEQAPQRDVLGPAPRPGVEPERGEDPLRPRIGAVLGELLRELVLHADAEHEADEPVVEDVEELAADGVVVLRLRDLFGHEQRQRRCCAGEADERGRDLESVALRRERVLGGARDFGPTDRRDVTRAERQRRIVAESDGLARVGSVAAGAHRVRNETLDHPDRHEEVVVLCVREEGLARAYRIERCPLRAGHRNSTFEG